MITGPQSGKIAGWIAPGADVDWYPIAAMRWAGLPVLVAIPGGFEVVAEIRRHPRRRLPWWYQLGVWTGEAYGWARSEVIALDMVGRAEPSDYSPTAFRPLDLSAWRHPLPPPLDPVFGPKRPLAPSIEPADDDVTALGAVGAGQPKRHQGSDDWPHPGLKLGGKGSAPASIEECEARLLRAFRTSASRAGGGAVGHAVASTCADIPREMVLASCAANAAYWAVHPDADGSTFEAVRSGWTPSKRDASDWDTALGWLNGLNKRAVRVVALRAADPPWSFRQIAERFGMKNQNSARWLYAKAMQHAFCSALRMPTSIRASAQETR